MEHPVDRMIRFAAVATGIVGVLFFLVLHFF